MTTLDHMAPDFYERSYATPGERYNNVYHDGVPEWATAMNQYVVDTFIALLGLFPERHPILDLGSGVGGIVKAWKQRDFSVTGVELAPTAVMLAADTDIVQGDVRDLKTAVGNQRFACATSIALLEHLSLSDCERMIDGVFERCESAAHVIGHEVGNDPSHINVHAPHFWRDWFNTAAARHGMTAMMITNVLAPTMPLFIQMHDVPEHLMHSIGVYHRDRIKVVDRSGRTM